MAARLKENRVDARRAAISLLPESFVGLFPYTGYNRQLVGTRKPKTSEMISRQ